MSKKNSVNEVVLDSDLVATKRMLDNAELEYEEWEGDDGATHLETENRLLFKFDDRKTLLSLGSVSE